MLRRPKPRIHHPGRVSAHCTSFARRRDLLRRQPVSEHARSRCGFGSQPLKYFTPWGARIPVALEFGESIVQNLFFRGARSWSLNHVLFLNFTKPAKDLISLISAQLWKLRENIGFAHASNLTLRWTNGKPPQPRRAIRR